MVRNAASMQSLRDSMADVSMSSQTNIRTTQQRAPSSPQPTSENGHQQVNVNLHGMTPLYGSNEYTKVLMNRIATGEATTEERAQWEKHVAMVKSKPLASVHYNALPQATTYPPPEPVTDFADRRPWPSPVRGRNLAMEDYQMQCMLLEQQNKKTRERAGLADAAKAEQEAKSAKLIDYKMQLNLLEKNNLKRQRLVVVQNAAKAADRPQSETLAPVQMSEFLTLARELQKAGEVASDRPQAQPQAAIQTHPSRPDALDDYHMQLKLLEQNIKKREARERQTDARVSTETNINQQSQVPQEFAWAFPDSPAAPSSEPQRKDTVAETPRFKQATRKNAAEYCEPFCKFLTDNPTVFHAVDSIKNQLKDAGFTALSERDSWNIKPSGSYFVERNGSSLIAFTVGANYKAGNGAAILAGHVDALTAKLKPISQVPNKAGYLQLGVAPYAGAPNTTWWDRDLSVGGRVVVKEGDKIVTKLVKLDWPIARIPTLAPHFGAAASGPFNQETQMVPIIGLEGTSTHAVEVEPFSQPPLLGGMNGPVGSFVATQPPALVKAISKALGMTTGQNAHIVNWELELFDVQPATVGGLEKEFIFAGRIDDKLCSWAAIQALIEAKPDTDDSSIIKVVGLFDDEEIGSGLRQGARGNLLPTVIERAVGSLADHKPTSDLLGRTYANSFLVSSDVTHAVNPNFLGSYLENHAPHLNVGVVVSADSNGHMTTDSVSTAVLKRCAEKVGANLQVFQIRNDSRSGGTVGPMLSSMTGVRAIDAGIPQLSMHSIRATTGSLDPGLGVLMFLGFLNGFEEVDKEFE